MKINSLSSVNSVSNVKLNVKNQKVNSTKATTNAIMNNSLAEAIGRSQVSFTGIANNSKNKFEYLQKNIGGSSEGFTYDKTTGVMEYTEKHSNDKIKKFVRIIPKTQEEFVQEIAKDGSYTIEVKSPSKAVYQEFDEKNNIKYRETEYPSGKKVTYDYDYANQRIINRIYLPDAEEPTVRVLDINSKLELPPNDERLIYKTKFHLDDGTTELREYNLVTGEIYRSEISVGGDLIKGFTRSFATGEITWRAKRVDSKLFQEFFTEDGTRTKDTITDFSADTEVIQEYAQDGSKLPKIKNFYDANGNIRKVAQYDVVTEKVQYVTSYTRDLKLVDTYEPKTNTRLTTEAYKNDELVASIEYYPDSKTSKREIEYSAEGFSDAPYCKKKVSHFDEKGRLRHVDLLGADDVKYETHYYNRNAKKPDIIRKYDANTGKYVDLYYSRAGKLEQRIKYSSNGEVLSDVRYYQDTNIKKISKVFDKDGSYIITRYSETGLPVECNSYSKFDDMLESISFYADGKSPKDYIAYNEDGSYRYVSYDRDGEIIEDYECNSDGTPRAARSRKFDFGAKDEPKEETIEDIIKNIMTIVGASNKSINDVPMTQWVKFTEFIGLEDVNQLFDMDAKTFRKMVKTFHPDSTLRPSHEIMQILNYFYKK